MGIYEQILNEDNTDAEAYWSLVLCRYGIEYVEDPSSHKRIPTVNRAQFTSIFDDDNYKSALQYADGYQRSIYEEEAKAVNEIQKGILAISQKEEPFDVFICYKETDNNGRRTPDSVLANDLYHQVTRKYENECRLIVSINKKLITNKCKIVQINLDGIDLGKSFERVYRGPNYPLKNFQNSLPSKLDNTIDWSLCDGKHCINNRRGI